MRTNTLRWAALVGVVLLLIAVGTVVAVPPADGYEISLYAAIPVFFWVALIGALSAGALVILGSATVSQDRTWRYGLSIMLLAAGILVVLPFLRGYAMYGRADALTHIGFIRDIIATDSVEGNVYPPLHLLTIAVADATRMELSTVAMVLPPVFSGLFFVSMYQLLRRVAGTRTEFLLGLPVTVLPILGVAHVSFRPFDASLMLLPFVYYLWVRSQRQSRLATRLPMVLALVALLLYHPLTGLFFIGIAGLYVIASELPRYRPQASYTNIASLSAAVFVGWYSGFTGIIIRFENVYETVFGVGGGEPPVQSYQQTVSESSPALIDVIRVIVFRYGVEMALFGLGFAFVGVLLLNSLHNREKLDLFTVTFAAVFVLSSLGGLGFLLSDLIVPQDRPWQVAKIIAAVLTGGLFYYLFRTLGTASRSQWLRKATSAAVVLTVVGLVVLAVLSLYPAPIQSEANNQVTEMEMQGSVWLTEYGQRETALMEFGTDYDRMHEALAGKRAEKPFVGSTPPPHFNYTRYDRFGDSYETDRYLTLTRRGRVTYPKMFEGYRAQWRYTPAEFARLERDRTVDRVYDNGGYTQYVVEGTRTAS